MPRILCSISTKGRSYTTLPMAIMAIANQTRKVDKLVIFDDNDNHVDLRSDPTYAALFSILTAKGIEWEWLYAGKKGQHHNHQLANWMGYDWVWRVDDDAIPEPQVLEVLSGYIADDVGAIGGAVFTYGLAPSSSPATGKIENIDIEPNIQWSPIMTVREVEHLHCTFMYRAEIVDYNTGLSKVAHREETLFTYALFRKGYRILAVPNAITWHLKSPTGGIRSESNKELYEHDERIFRNFLDHKDHTIVVLNNGKGDHVVFSHVLPDIKNPIVFGCYPDIVPCRSIAEAQYLFGDIDTYNIYGKMSRWNWKNSLEGAFRKMYAS